MNVISNFPNINISDETKELIKKKGSIPISLNLRIIFDERTNQFIIQPENKIDNDEPIRKNLIFKLRVPFYHRSYVIGLNQQDAYEKLMRRIKVNRSLITSLFKKEDLVQVPYNDKIHVTEEDFHELTHNNEKILFSKFSNIIYSYNGTFNTLFSLIRDFNFFDSERIQRFLITSLTEFIFISKEIRITNTDNSLNGYDRINFLEQQYILNTLHLLVSSMKELSTFDNIHRSISFSGFIKKLTHINYMMYN